MNDIEAAKTDSTNNNVRVQLLIVCVLQFSCFRCKYDKYIFRNKISYTIILFARFVNATSLQMSL